LHACDPISIFAGREPCLRLERAGLGRKRHSEHLMPHDLSAFSRGGMAKRWRIAARSKLRRWQRNHQPARTRADGAIRRLLRMEESASARFCAGRLLSVLLGGGFRRFSIRLARFRGMGGGFSRDVVEHAGFLPIMAFAGAVEAGEDEKCGESGDFLHCAWEILACRNYERPAGSGAGS
jgi:hypothetical protein